MDHGRNDPNKRRAPRNETETKEAVPSTSQPTVTAEDQEADDKPIPDDLSEISDDPDDILDRDDVICNYNLIITLFSSFMLYPI